MIVRLLLALVFICVGLALSLLKGVDEAPASPKGNTVGILDKEYTYYQVTCIQVYMGKDAPPLVFTVPDPTFSTFGTMVSPLGVYELISGEMCAITHQLTAEETAAFRKGSN